MTDQPGAAGHELGEAEELELGDETGLGGGVVVLVAADLKIISGASVLAFARTVADTEPIAPSLVAVIRTAPAGKADNRYVPLPSVPVRIPVPSALIS